MRFVNPDEAIKRLAAAQGIDYLNLIKPQQQLQQEAAQQQQQQAQQELVKQTGQFVNSPSMDPTKNPEALETANAIRDQLMNTPEQQEQ